MASTETATVLDPAADTPCSRRVAQESAGKCSKTKEEVGWRRIIRNFTPSWFAVTMGTGIVSILLRNLPYNLFWVENGLSVAFFIINIALFTVFTGICIVRYSLYPEIWIAMMSHPGQSLFLGCFPMGLATITNMTVMVCSHWGDWVVYLAWGLWWLDALLSIATCVSVPFFVMHRHRPGLQAVTAAYLLPIVPTVVAAATGGIVADALPSRSHALTTLVASYVLWGIGQCFSALVLALYLHRLTVHSLPPREAIVSVFLPIGPLGQGGYGIQQLGKVALKLFPSDGTSASAAAGTLQSLRHGGEVLYVLGVFLALCMWGFALVWLSFALISLAALQKFPFNMGWWGFTFPLGVLATCTGMLARDLDSAFFRALTMVFSLCVFLLWLVVAVHTLRQALTGEIFHAPCLKDIREKGQQGGEDRRV
ncbi:voltage-dependent anion channel [Plectosphaerella cucumerina]|uniref:Sulfite efflux pump SSU1 n=1 Tax=Plectosphaerella cucumerina TaxID=40658 RepID=A0A8K0T9Y9_9PEZI|nr:voltage-dependent anion channel [Plectosphaerella cucumerina]